MPSRLEAGIGNLLLVTVIAAGLSLAPAVAAPPAGTKGASFPALETALERGALLYLYDEAAWRGSDDLTTHFAPLMPLIGGYVVSGDEAAVELVFYDKARSKAIYRVKFANQKMVSSGLPAGDRVGLTSVEERLIAAHKIATKAFEDAKVSPCNKATRNLALLLPKSPSDPVRAYLMTPRTDMRSLPPGGHYAVDVSANGTTGPVRAYTKSCLELPFATNAKQSPEALVVCHLLDPTPTEIHVFSALTGKVKVIVATTVNQRIWYVTGRQILLIMEPPGKKVRKDN